MTLHHRWSAYLQLRANASDGTLQNTTRNPDFHLPGDLFARLRFMSRAVSTVLFLTAFFPALIPQTAPAQNLPTFATVTSAAPAAANPPAANTAAAVACGADSDQSPQAVPCREPQPETRPLIVIGFMGGRIHAGNLAHKEALIARDLDRRYPNAVDAMTFANHRERDALRTVLNLLDTGRDGRLSEEEKKAARIVIYGHSWGASETVNFARQLARLGIPVLLTIQVDSIEKSGENDSMIPANVREAINFYQADGLLHGRSFIQAVDPQRTAILGNYESAYKSNPVSCPGYSWYARTFMKPHIEIENDRAVWDRIEALIVTLFLPSPSLPSPSRPSAVARTVPVGAEK
jgi:hypothetical protein